VYIHSVAFTTVSRRDDHWTPIAAYETDVTNKPFIQNGIDRFSVIVAAFGEATHLGLFGRLERTHASRVEPRPERVNFQRST
jgi:hypothetical protein